MAVTKVYFESGSAYRARGMWGHPVTFGHSMALSLMMLLGFSIAMPKSKWKYIAWASTLACGLALLWSYTRGAWIGVAAAVFMMSLYLGRKVAIASILSGVILVGGGATISEKFRDRLTSIVSMTNQSNTERLDVWRANIAMFKDNPILGVGYGVNEEIIGDYYTKLGITQEFGGHAHNNYLQFLSGTGLLGFAAYTAFSLIFLWMSHRLLRTLPKDAHWQRAIAIGALGAQVALHVGGLTECNFKDAEVNHQYMLILALLMVVWRQNAANRV
jgi:O-antigen ligase